MKYSFLLLFLLVLLSSCQTEPQAFVPEFINFEAVANNADDITASRKTEAFRGKVSVSVLENELVAIVDQEGGSRSIAYVLQTESRADAQPFEFANAWVVYLQDHLLIVDEKSNRKIRWSIAGRALDSPVVSESMTFTETVSGYGLARYTDQVVRKEDLNTSSSYLEARSRQ